MFPPAVRFVGPDEVELVTDDESCSVAPAFTITIAAPSTIAMGPTSEIVVPAPLLRTIIPDIMVSVAEPALMLNELLCTHSAVVEVRFQSVHFMPTLPDTVQPTFALTVSLTSPVTLLVTAP